MTRPDIRTLIQEGTEQIGRFETMVLLAHALGVRREFLIAHDLDVPDEEKAEKFRLYVVMRKSGTPVPYITGEQDFYGRFFEVNPSVLIPRPDTEVLVDTALELFDEAPRVLDLGTGSGCLAVTLALEMKNSWRPTSRRRRCLRPNAMRRNSGPRWRFAAAPGGRRSARRNSSTSS